MLEENNIKYQIAELGKVEVGGGGTIAYIALYRRLVQNVQYLALDAVGATVDRCAHRPSRAVVDRSLRLIGDGRHRRPYPPTAYPH